MNKKACDFTEREPTATRARWRTEPSQVLPPPVPLDHHIPEDSVLHSCAPPLVEADEESMAGERLTGDLLKISTRDVPRHQTESAGWLSSLALHAVLLLLLGLLLAPIDLAGVTTRQLVVMLSDEVSLETATVSADFSGSDDAPDDPLPPVDQPQPVPLDGSFALDSSPAPVPSGSVKSADGAKAGSTGARGSFFGIEAYGHDFVYVLDMSGSMRGRRFKRATAELVRSVGELRDSQNFYVLLFNGSMVQMFGEDDAYPTPIAATAGNKERLSRWLRKAFRGGSTDPREAIRTALRMDPSAVFILSDGEFDDPKQNGETNMLRGNSDAFSIVEMSSSEAPIHAIAFEDPKSCENMKRLALISGGEYRFAEFQDSVAAKESLVAARDAMVRGETATAELLMREIIESFGHTEAGWDARKELAAMLFESAQNAIQKGNDEIVKETLLRIVEMDPTAMVTAEYQQQLTDNFMQPVEDGLADGERPRRTKIAMLDDLVEQFPKSKAAARVAGSVAKQLLADAREFDAQGDHVRSLRNMEHVVKNYPKTAAARECQQEAELLSGELWSKAQELRRTADNVVYAKHLRTLTTTFDGTQLKNRATQALEELATELLVKVRDANTRRDWETKRVASQQLADAFAGDPRLASIQRQFAKNEMQARDLLRRGNRLERSAGVEVAIERYNEVLQKYGGTLAAQRAQERLRDLAQQDQSSAADEEAALVLEMMLQQGE